MSREELKNFIKATDQNIILHEKLIQCKTQKDLILLAKQYGYIITLEDVNYNKIATKFESWFRESKINALR